MKYFVTQVLTRAGPREDALAINEAAREWVEARLADGTMDSAYSFLDGSAFGIVNAESHDDLLDLLTGYPLYWYMDWEVKALCHWSRRMDKAIELQRQQAG